MNYAWWSKGNLNRTSIQVLVCKRATVCQKDYTQMCDMSQGQRSTISSYSSTTITRVQSTRIVSICVLWSGLCWTSLCQGRGIREQQGMDCLYTCCITRAVHLELVPGMSAPNFLRSFKRFNARRGIPLQMI